MPILSLFGTNALFHKKISIPYCSNTPDNHKILLSMNNFEQKVLLGKKDNGR